MKTPKFWKDENIFSFLLFPLSFIYSFFRKLHVIFSKKFKCDNLKIVCIGNLTAGGSGKTPIAIEVGKILKEKGINFAYLSKGYKGKNKEFTKVNTVTHTSIEVGDEPLLLAEYADTFVCKSRKVAIETLSKNYNYSVIVMDDGFQNPNIIANKNVIVIDGEYGIGNGETLPSGPLREGIEKAFERANFFIIIGQDKQNLEESLVNNNFEVVRAFIKEKNNSNLKDNYIAFCGIGRCEKFFKSLKNAKYNILKEFSFADHYFYKEEDLQKLFFEAEKLEAKLITTKKDWIKLSSENKLKIEFLDIEVDFYNKDKFVELLLQ